jgi:hypothetical protein
MRRQLKHLALTGTTAALLVLTAACSASGPTRAGSPSKAAICSEAGTALDAFTAAVAKINIGNNGTAAWEAKAKELSSKLGQIAGKTEDAELKSVLLEMSNTWASIKLDGQAGADSSDKLLSEEPDKLAKACL